MLQFDGEEAADLTNRYLWANAVDQILADEQVTTLSSAGDVYWPLTDNQGTVRQLAFYDSGSGDTTIQRYWEYDSFGNVTSETAAAVDHLFGYTGRAFDDATGLQNNLHRWYDPVTGRWASEDPIGFAAGDANLYRYVGNGPTNGVDPTGLEDPLGLGSLLDTFGNTSSQHDDWTPPPVGSTFLTSSDLDRPLEPIFDAEAEAEAMRQVQSEEYAKYADMTLEEFAEHMNEIVAWERAPMSDREMLFTTMDRYPDQFTFCEHVAVSIWRTFAPANPQYYVHLRNGKRVFSTAGVPSSDALFLQAAAIYAPGRALFGRNAARALAGEAADMLRDEAWNQLTGGVPLIPLGKPRGGSCEYNPSSFKGAPKKGGRRGNQATRDHLDEVRDEFLDANPDYQHVAGGRDRLTGAELPEEYLPPLDGGRRGGSYPDLTFQGPDGGRVRFNTTDTLADGTLTSTERINRDRIFEQTGEPIITVPKPRQHKPKRL
ncbi:MAG: RHS repeat-associated core domain-containing protein [Planctomycetota bacterium]|nr:MAG: RHS repeat-associated core domain-containing protein [Planctomycetota bacterium]REK18063.1 MAG: RHS repeat-associated core domain-containing protein [Planctomycetota bacterium]REK40215.1 MAG: RHS repeat-associated core domain-containing protein [Planctomycetota bacterium]